MTVWSFVKAAQFMDPVRPASSIKDLQKMHRRVGGGLDSISLRNLLSPHFDPETRRCRLLFLNTYLISFEPFFSSPERKKRARRIGRAAAEGRYDVAAFCEVFDSDEKNLVRDYFKRGSRDQGRGVTAARGPLSEGPPITTSGLYTIASVDFPIRGWVRHTFRDRGQDHEGYANKGVLLSVVDPGVGQGQLEIYSTHFNANDKNVREHQVFDLVEFVDRTHDAANVAFIVGDFNITADGHQHSLLVDSLGGDRAERGLASFTDVWAERNRTDGPTIDLARNPEICPSGADGLCDDYARSPRGGGRVDYIFSQNADPRHRISVQYSRPRRRAFWWPDGEDIQSLSDHLALEVTLLISAL